MTALLVAVAAFIGPGTTIYQPCTHEGRGLACVYSTRAFGDWRWTSRVYIHHHGRDIIVSLVGFRKEAIHGR